MGFELSGGKYQSLLSGRWTPPSSHTRHWPLPPIVHSTAIASAILNTFHWNIFPSILNIFQEEYFLWSGEVNFCPRTRIPFTKKVDPQIRRGHLEWQHFFNPWFTLRGFWGSPTLKLSLPRLDTTKKIWR